MRLAQICTAGAAVLGSISPMPIKRPAIAVGLGALLGVLAFVGSGSFADESSPVPVTTTRSRRPPSRLTVTSQGAFAGAVSASIPTDWKRSRTASSSGAPSCHSKRPRDSSCRALDEPFQRGALVRLQVPHLGVRQVVCRFSRLDVPDQVQPLGDAGFTRG